MSDVKEQKTGRGFLGEVSTSILARYSRIGYIPSVLFPVLRPLL
jgi:hypothetical protein